MKIHTNEQKIRRNRIRQLIGIVLTMSLLLVTIFAVVLLVTYLISPALANSPVLLIAIGLLSTFIGLQVGNQLSGLPAAHEALNDALKGLDADHHLYHYYLPADHVLITPRGTFTIAARTQKTNVSFEDGKPRTQDGLIRRFTRSVTGQPLGKPMDDALTDAAQTLQWLQQHLNAGGVEVQPVLVFVHPEAEVDVVGESPVPILRPDKRKPSLKAYVKDYPQSETALTAADIDVLNEILRITA